MALMAVKIERYHADLVTGRKTYYLADGDFEDVEGHKFGGAALSFSAGGVEKAVRAIQAGRSLIANSAAGSPTRAASVILSASPAGARSIMAAPGTSMSNGFPAPSHNRFIAYRVTPRQRTIPCSTTSCCAPSNSTS